MMATSNSREALEALMALGYSNDEAEGVLSRIDMTDKKNTEAIIKEALRVIMAG